MELLAKYDNGNYTVKLYDNGTKIRFTKADSFVAEFPENIDIKITDQCDAGCPFCHENSTKNGEHAKFWDDNSIKFYESLRPGTELAIGGGNPLAHPDLVEFLEYMKSRGIVCNLTVNSKHITENSMYFLDQLMSKELIHGLGVSVNQFDMYSYTIAKLYDNVVLHVINGVMPYEDLMKYASSDVKILILGYKMFRRGKQYYDDKVAIIKSDIYSRLEKIMNSFHTISFDNLGIEQLQPQRFMTTDEWNKFYMGDDGNFTMYIDLVKQKFAKNSTSQIRYDITDNIVDMFKVVKEESHESCRDIRESEMA